jgi:hypothetical protein
MSADGSLKLEWGGKERTFRLLYGQIRELEESRTVYAKGETGSLVPLESGMVAVAYSGALKCIVERLRTGLWLLEDITETIRLGLVGGGMTRFEAAALIRRECIAPFPPHAQVATAIILAAIIGVRDDPLPKPKVAKATRRRSTARGASASATSTASVPPLE